MICIFMCMHSFAQNVEPTISDPKELSIAIQQKEEVFKQLFKDPTNLSLLFKYANLSIMVGDLEGAIGVFEQMLIYDSELPRIRLELGVLYFRLGAFALANNYLKSVKEYNPPSEVEARVDQFLEAIVSAEEPFQWQQTLSIGFKRTTNGNSGINADFIEIGDFLLDVDPESRRQSDRSFLYNYSLSIDQDLNHPRGDNIQYFFSYGADRLDTFKQFDVQSNVFSVRRNFNLDENFFSFFNLEDPVFAPNMNLLRVVLNRQEILRSGRISLDYSGQLDNGSSMLFTYYREEKIFRSGRQKNGRINGISFGQSYVWSGPQALYGYNPGTTSFLPPPEKAEKEMYKLDYYINENHRLEYVYSFSEDNTVRPYNYDIRFSSHYYNYPAMTEKDTYAYYGDISDNLYVQAKYSEVEWANDQDALGGEDFPHVEIRITAPDGSYTSGNRESIFLGPDKYRSANEGFAFDEILNLKAVYTMGDHEITVGYDSIDKRLGNLFISRENGAYQFKGVDNYYAGIPSFFRFNKSATGDPYYAMAGFSGTFETLYVQDKFYVSDILTVNYGLRYDSFEMDSGPAYNEYGSGLLGFRNDTPASTSILQPRFGFQLDATNLDMFSSDKIVAAELRGGYGLFAGRVPNVWLASPFANSGVVQYGSRYYSPCQTAGDRTCFKAPETISQDFPYSEFARTSPAQAIDPNYDTPSTWKLNLELLLTTADGTNVKLAFNKDDSEDGIGFSDASATVDQVGATGVVTYDTKGAFYVTNAEGTNSQSVTISMDKTFDNGVDIFASYTNLDAESGWVATSSQLSSNLEYMPRVDLMNVGVGKTPWAIEDRIVAGLNYTANWFPNSPTKFSLFYKAYSGKRFSYVFDGIDDGYDDGNTLLYIPTLNDPNVVYSGVTEAEVLSVVQGIGTPGSHVAANSGQVPWTRSLDLRISQEIPMPVLDHKLFVYFDVLNVLNLINEDKGHAYYQRYSSRQVLDSDGLDSQGRIIITGTDDRGASIDTYASRYRMQLGFVYKF